MQGTAEYQGQVGSTFAGACVQFDLVTHGDDQYVAFYDVNRDIVVKHRTLPDGAWTFKRILESSYNPDADGYNLSYKHDWDSHNWLRLAVDGSGNLHLVGDMHRNEIRYWRTSTPGNLSTLSRDWSLVDNAIESMATYPEFILAPNGNLGWMTFRDGRSGNGDTYVYRWHNSTKAWTKVCKLFDRDSAYFGDGHGNAYYEILNTINGWYHIIFNWRETGDPDSNSRFSYVKTENWVDFFNVRDVAISTPITADTVRTTVDPLPTIKSGTDWLPNGLVNGEYHFITIEDYTVLAYSKLGVDSNGATNKQLYAAVYQQGDPGWTINQITEEPGGVGLVGNTWPDNYVIVMDGGIVAVDYKYSHAEARPMRRVSFDPADVHLGPFTSVACPKYFPDEVYQATDSFPGCTSHVESDSRSRVQTVGNRNYINSRPVNGDTLYVMSWLAGPETFDPLPPEPSYPDRPIHMYKVTY